MQANVDINGILNVLGAKGSLALFVVYFMNWLKKSKYLPLINYESDKLNHFVAILLTGLAGLGIHFKYNAGDHSLVISGLVLSTIVSGVWNWIQQYLMTKITYTMLKDKLNPVVVGTTILPAKMTGAQQPDPKA